MTETSQLRLPLLQPAQAQKHVTVNEALVRLDGLSQLVLQSRSLSNPPGSVGEGATYMVPAGAVNAWGGQDGKIAIYSNGGWVFVPPLTGWRGWISDESKPVIFDGSDWVPETVVQSANGAQTRLEILEADHVLGAGADSTTSMVIPQYASVTAVTGRILTAIGGSLTGWSLGVAGAPTRYASGLGLATGSWVVGASGSPLTYYADTPLLLSAEGGSFASGTVRLAIHMQVVTPPAV